jgi:hypothetical protein
MAAGPCKPRIVDPWASSQFIEWRPGDQKQPRSPLGTAPTSRAIRCPAGRVGHHRDLAHPHRAPLRPRRHRGDRRHRLPVVRPVRHTAGRAVLAREPDTTTGYHLALFTTDTHAGLQRIVERYAQRWSIEPANAVGQTTARSRPSPQPRRQSGRAHRAVRVPRPNPGDHLVHAVRLPPRRPHPPRPTEPWYHDKSCCLLAKLRRTPHRRPIFGHHTKSARRQHNPRLPAGMRRSRRITAKVESC